MSEIATENAELTFTNSAGPQGTTATMMVSALPITITKAESCKAEGHCMITTQIQGSFSSSNACPFSLTTHTFVSGVFSLTASAVNVRAEGNPVHLQGESANNACSGSWSDNSSGSPVPCQCNVEISNSGQTSVMGT